MYWMIRTLPLRRVLAEQAPPFFAAFVVAEVFDKFHSFTLECAAFLLTWAAIDALVDFFRRKAD